MRSEKGSITLYVLLAMLTLTAFLMAIYIKNANVELAQAETTKKIKSIYENYDIDEVYTTMQKSIPKILGYTKKENAIVIKTLTENGASVDQNGKEILYYAATENETAPNLPEDKNSVAENEVFGQWQKSKEIAIPSGITKIYIWIINEDGDISNYESNPIDI